jgi:hypothetical protein
MCNQCESVLEYKQFIVTSYGEYEVWAKSSEEAVDLISRQYPEQYEGDFSVKEMF